MITISRTKAGRLTSGALATPMTRARLLVDEQIAELGAGVRVAVSANF